MRGSRQKSMRLRGRVTRLQKSMQFCTRSELNAAVENPSLRVCCRSCLSERCLTGTVPPAWLQERAMYLGHFLVTEDQLSWTVNLG
jgi:hypothetical protein